MKKVFSRMTDIPSDMIEARLRSPQLALFVFQFADYSSEPRDVSRII